MKKISHDVTIISNYINTSSNNINIYQNNTTNIFNVHAPEYMQNFAAISTGATISPYLSSRTGLRPKYISGKKQRKNRNI